MRILADRLLRKLEMPDDADRQAVEDLAHDRLFDVDQDAGTLQPRNDATSSRETPEIRNGLHRRERF
jgi:hypothetical protein